MILNELEGILRISKIALKLLLGVINLNSKQVKKNFNPIEIL